VNEELRRVFEEDQGDRLAEELPADMRLRDRARRKRVVELLDAGAAETGEDFFHAAMVFQHGEELADYRRAHELALRAAELGHGTGRWLAAAAHDRWLMHEGKPQKYGTQYRGTGDGFELYEVDPATTDEERAEWNVPPLAEARRRAGDLPAARAAARPAVTFRAGDLELQVFAITAGSTVRTETAAGPLRDGDPLPSWLPPGLTPGRTENGFQAMDRATGTWVGWHRAMTPQHFGWLEENGPLPQPETVAVAGGTGISWPTGKSGLALLFTAPGGQRWMVRGTCSREELIRVAESLP
jgi:hypothetical protein